MMMIFVRVFYWVYLDISGSLDTSNSTEVQSVSAPQPPPVALQELSPISISRLYQSSEFYGENSVFKNRRNIVQNIPAIIDEEEEDSEGD